MIRSAHTQPIVSSTHTQTEVMSAQHTVSQNKNNNTIPSDSVCDKPVLLPDDVMLESADTEVSGVAFATSASTSKECSYPVLTVNLRQDMLKIPQNIKQTSPRNPQIENRFKNEASPTSQNVWRRPCGCLKTSEKLKELLKQFPVTPPPIPTVLTGCPGAKAEYTCISSFCTSGPDTCVSVKELKEKKNESDVNLCRKTMTAKSWQFMTDIGQVLQLSVTATALALYYIIYCYMQLIYFTLKSAIYFHNADVPMRITIGVVTATSLIVGFNLLHRMERMVGIIN